MTRWPLIALALLAPVPSAEAATLGLGRADHGLAYDAAVVEPESGRLIAVWQEDATRFGTCVAPRGAKACAARPVLTPAEASALHPFVVDGTVYVAGFSADATWLWTSADGGATFSDADPGTPGAQPARIYGRSGGAFDIAGGELVAASSGGTVFGARLDGTEAAETAAATLPGAPSSSLDLAALPGGGLEAAAPFGELVQKTHTWALAPGQDPSRTESWSQGEFPGSLSGLASGGGEAWLATTASLGHWEGAGFSTPYGYDPRLRGVRGGGDGSVFGLDGGEILILRRFAHGRLTETAVAHDEHPLTGSAAIDSDSGGWVVYRTSLGQVRAAPLPELPPDDEPQVDVYDGPYRTVTRGRFRVRFPKRPVPAGATFSLRVKRLGGGRIKRILIDPPGDGPTEIDRPPWRERIASSQFWTRRTLPVKVTIHTSAGTARLRIPVPFTPERPPS